ncbi:MAG TPA: adenylosuccinate lyase [Aggregatilinea sp.]|uniref:adenylosuccinate lyase n=1 Tax=Aggregatilinea sp. TaxID=2806333 RepID=UPI002BA87A16|nr:adenylosuccinate lyase [Aggregatilinea sp.]HML20176.1 adenylosuccinate lyase [Aggregatilinea sp.]
MDSLQFDHTTYLSPLTWRYGSEAMREVWSQHRQRRLWRQVWTALAEAQAASGLIGGEQVADIQAHAEDIDLERSSAVEAEIHHDLMAELRVFASQCAVGGGALHLGATSADIEDNADVLRVRQALDLTLEGLRALLAALADQIDAWADVTSMGFTHIQPAEPTTVGYRLAQYAQDLLMDWGEVRRVRDNLRGKGIKGAVGTSASYMDLLAGTGWTAAQLEADVMRRLNLDTFTVSTQVYARKQDWLVLNALAGIAGSANKLMLDLRVLQSPPFGEWAEPFREKQVGSSAMPFKRNPINAEKVNSLARWVAALPRVAWDNAALTILERSLDDSANRRLMFPEAFLTVDEIVQVCTRIVRDLRVNRAAIERNVAIYGVFAAVERVLMALGRAGADRQEMHERLRTHSMAAWAEVSQGRSNPLPDLLRADETITAIVPEETLLALLDASAYVGDAPERARRLAGEIRQALS